MKDPVEITPPLVELIRLVRNQNSLSQTARLLKLGRTKLCAILRGDKEHKNVREHVFTNAVQYLTRENRFSLDELCSHLGITQKIKNQKAFEKLFIPVRVSDRSRIAEEINDYIRKKEISQEEFLRELNAYSDPYLKKISGATIKKFLHGDNKGADIKMLKALNKFATEKRIDQLEEKESSYEDVIRRANRYIQTAGIDKTEFGRRVAAHDPSVGKPDSVRRWLSGKSVPQPLNKIRIIEKYLEKTETLSRIELEKYLEKTKILSKIKPSSNIDGLYLALNPRGSLEEIAAKTNLEGALPKDYGKLLTAQIEQAVIDHHRKNGKQELAPLVLSNVFGRRLCRTSENFCAHFPNLAAYLEQAYDAGLVLIFEEALSFMSHEDLIGLAGNYGSSQKIKPRLDVLAGDLGFKLETLKKISETEVKTAKDEEGFSITFKLTRGVQITRSQLEYELMKKIDPSYWPSHKKI